MHRRRFLKRVTAQTAAVATLPAVLTSCSEGGAEQDSREPASGAPDERLVQLFSRHLELCKVKEGETLLFYSTPDYRRKEYIPAMLTAAKAKGAQAFALEAMPGLTGSKLLVDAFKAADIVYGQIPLYADAHNAALAEGTRTVTLTVEVETLERFFPQEEAIRRGYAGAERLTQAREIRVTDAQGCDFTMRKDGRKGSAMVGVSAEPGTWDQFPHGSVACAPLEDKSEGIYLVNPGDTISGLGRHVESPVRMTLKGGRITKIEGGEEADFIRKRITAEEGFRDPQGRFADPWVLGHAGWGIDRRADWNIAPGGRDSQMLYGSVMVSIGVNFLNAPARYSGFAGQNHTPVHIDICCRHKNLYLDGKLALNGDEKFLLPELV